MSSSFSATAPRSGAGARSSRASAALPPERSVVGLVILDMRHREPRRGAAVAGEGLHPPLVIPAKAGIHEHGSVGWSDDSVHRFRVEPGMTGDGKYSPRAGGG